MWREKKKKKASISFNSLCLLILQNTNSVQFCEAVGRLVVSSVLELATVGL